MNRLILISLMMLVSGCASLTAADQAALAGAAKVAAHKVLEQSTGTVGYNPAMDVAIDAAVLAANVAPIE